MFFPGTNAKKKFAADTGFWPNRLVIFNRSCYIRTGVPSRQSRLRTIARRLYALRLCGVSGRHKSRFGAILRKIYCGRDMYMKRLILLLTVIVSFALGTISLKAQSKGSILLAYEKTKFKDALIAELETLFTRDGFTVVVATHSKKGLDGYKASDFRAVFITNSGVNSKVRPWVSDWIKANRNPNTYILLHTTQAKDWKVIADVDTVTSASTQADVKKLANEYYKHISAALK